MSIYFFAYAFLIFFSFIFYKSKQKTQIICLFGFIIWVLIIGLRHPSMGVDLQYGKSTGYLAVYEFIAEAPWEDVLHKQFLNYERGYIIFNKLLSYLSQNSQMLLFSSAIIAIGSVSLLIAKNSKSAILSFVLYCGLSVFMLTFSGIRQAIAISITILAFFCIKKKKIFLFILLTLLASAFHASALVFLIAYPIYYIPANKPILKFLSVPLLLIVYLLRNPLFSLFSRLFKENAQNDENGSFMLFFFFTIIYIFALFFENKLNHVEIGYRNLFYVACICQAFSGVYATAMRVGYYFMIYLILLIPEIIFFKEDSCLINKKLGTVKMSTDAAILYTAFFVFFLFWGLLQLKTSTWAMTNPHSFFWE